MLHLLVDSHIELAISTAVTSCGISTRQHMYTSTHMGLCFTQISLIAFAQNLWILLWLSDWHKFQGFGDSGMGFPSRLFRQIRSYLPEPFRHLKSYLPKPFWQIRSWMPEPLMHSFWPLFTVCNSLTGLIIQPLSLILVYFYWFNQVLLREASCT